MSAEDILRTMLIEMNHQDPDDFIKEFKERVDQPLDGKFSGMVWRTRDGQIEESFIVFVPRDQALVSVLESYRAECMEIGAGDEQIAAVSRLRDRVVEWQKNNPTKIPDAEPGECK